LSELARVTIVLLLTIPLGLPMSQIRQSTINPHAWCTGLSGNGPGPTLNGTMIWVPEARAQGGFSRSFNDAYAAKGPSCSKAADRMIAFTFEGQLNGTKLAQTGDDQFAIFATDDTVRFKGREWGWVTKLTDNAILGYYQDPLTGSGLVYCVTGLAADNIRHTFIVTVSAGWRGGVQTTILRYIVDGKVRCSLAVPDPQFSQAAYTLWFTTHRTENSWDAGNGVGVKITRSYYEPLRPGQ